MPRRRGDRGGGHLGERRRAVCRAEIVRGRGAEIVAVERFRRAAGEIRLRRESARHAPPRPCPARASAPSRSAACAGMAPHPVVDRRVARAGIEGEDVAAGADPGDVADPAEIEHGDRLVQAGGERGMVERRERRPLAARRDIGAAEIGDDIDAGQPGEQRAVADLPGPALGPARAGSCGRESRSARRAYLREAPAELARPPRHAAGSARPRPPATGPLPPSTPRSRSRNSSA